VFVIAYTGPSPPAGTGLHRYQLLLFEQEDDDIDTVIKKESERGSWDLNAFVQANNLCYSLVAAQQFQADHKN